MTENLLDHLAQRAPREIAGARSASRFDFQKNWAICRVLDLHESEVDYLVILDYHEDVIVLNSETNPSAADFVQVKTNSGHWTLSPLTKRTTTKASGKLPSILGKLCSNIDGGFAESPESTICMTSNARFHLKLANGENGKSQTKIRWNDLDTGIQSKIVEKLRSEGVQTESLPRLRFEVSSLSMTDHSAHALGRLTDFLDREYPGATTKPAPLYKTLFHEFKRRTNREGTFADPSSLSDAKGIGRSFITRTLADAVKTEDLDTLWQEASGRLIQEGLSSLQVRVLRAHWSEHEIARMDATNTVLQELRSALLHAGRAAWIESPNSTLMEICEKSVTDNNDLVARAGLDCERARVITLMEIYADPPISKPGAETEASE